MTTTTENKNENDRTCKIVRCKICKQIIKGNSQDMYCHILRHIAHGIVNTVKYSLTFLGLATLFWLLSDSSR